MLLVDPDIAAAAAIVEALPATVDVAVRSDFLTARTRLRLNPPKLLVTALRLREYNGLHLVHLAAGAGLPTRSIVYTDVADLSMAREIHRAGAFHEVRSQLAVTLPAYTSAVLPSHDRRDVIGRDRRQVARGGRRAADQPRSSSC